MDVQLTLRVEVPQLEGVTTTLHHIGAQLMADMQGLHQAITDLAATLDQELAEIQQVLQQGHVDQTQLDAAVAQLGDMRVRLAAAVTPAPPPAPPAAPPVEPPPAG